jgi:hypothetical protein
MKAQFLARYAVKDSFALGEGLIEDYLAESLIAKYPRIILHPNVQENKKVIEKIEFLSNVIYGGKSLIQKDPDDGMFFLDYIG